MLLLFSASWYWSIAQMLRSGRVDGKSFMYVFVVFIGYCAGLTAQLVRMGAGEGSELLLGLYAFNLVIVLADALLIRHLQRRQRAKAEVIAGAA